MGDITHRHLIPSDPGGSQKCEGNSMNVNELP